MAVIRKEQKEKSRNALLRVSVPASLIAEIKKGQKALPGQRVLF